MALITVLTRNRALVQATSLSLREDHGLLPVATWTRLSWAFRERPVTCAVIDGSALPTLPENRTYQLWAIVGERVISVGVMGNRPEITAFRVEGQLAGLAISEEILGGVVVSEQDPVGVWLDEA